MFFICSSCRVQLEKLRLKVGESTMRTRVWAFSPFSTGVVSALAFLSLSACDGAPSAIPARSHAAGDTADRRLADSSPEGGNVRNTRYNTTDGGSRAEAPADTPLFHG